MKSRGFLQIREVYGLGICQHSGTMLRLRSSCRGRVGIEKLPSSFLPVNILLNQLWLPRIKLPELFWVLIKTIWCVQLDKQYGYDAHDFLLLSFKRSWNACREPGCLCLQHDMIFPIVRASWASWVKDPHQGYMTDIFQHQHYRLARLARRCWRAPCYKSSADSDHAMSVGFFSRQAAWRAIDRPDQTLIIAFRLYLQYFFLSPCSPLFLWLGLSISCGSWLSNLCWLHS